ncbi:hypothetical protein Tco_1459258 [Tanacetum coccineum]
MCILLMRLKEDGFNDYYEGNGSCNVVWLNASDEEKKAEHSKGKDLDTTPLRDLIDFMGKLIPEDPQPGVPRVGIPIPPRSFLQDLYDKWVGDGDMPHEGIKRWSIGIHITGTNNVPLLGEEELLPFVCKMGKSSCNKKWAMENLNFFYQDIGTSSSASGHLTQEEAVKEALPTRMSRKFVLLEEERPIIETMAYHDKYKKILDEIWKDKVELDGKIVKEEEEAVKRIKGEALKEKDDPEAFIFSIKLEGQTFDGFCHQTFCATRSDVMRNAESDSDDKEEYQIQGNKFGAPIYGPKPASYLNCNDPAERSLAIQTVTNLLWKITVWKKVVSFLGSLPVPSKHVNWKPDYKGCNKDAKSRYNTRLAQLLPRHVYSPCVMNWDILNKMGCDGEIDDMLRIRLREAESNKEIFTSVAWIRSFNINEPIYAELCHEFYSTYEFDEVCADDELQTKKIIKFRLGGRAHNLTLLEFAHRLGLYQADELKEDGFNVYFEGGLRSDEHFNAQEYWVIHKMITYGLCQRTAGYDKIQKNDLWLLSMFDATHQNGYANVGWLIARWMKRKGAGTQKESQICCGQFILKIARKCRVLTEDVVRSLSDPIYCRDLETTPLRDLIDSEGKLILEDPQPGVPRVGIPRPPGASMQDLYDRMGRM